MEIQEILSSLSSAEQDVLEKAVVAAVEELRREPEGKLSSELRAAVRQSALHPEALPKDAPGRQAEVALLALGFANVKAAFAELFSLGRSEAFFKLLKEGDWLHRNFHRLIGAMASTDDLPMIGDMILDGGVPMPAREQALLSFHFLLMENVVPEKEIVEEYRRLLSRGLPPDDDWKMWMALVVNASVIGGQKLKPAIMEILESGRLGEQTSFVRKAVMGLFSGGNLRFKEMLRREHRSQFVNIADEVKELLAPPQAENVEMPERGKPIVREEPKVGRNDPCPCGSGKKYKKCCGMNA